MSLKKRIQILLVFLVGVPFLLLLYESYRTGRSTVLRQMRADAVHTAHLQAAQLEELFTGPRLAAESVARALACDATLDPQRVKALLRQTLQESEGTFGMAVALPGGGSPFIPYVCRSAGGLQERDLAGPGYDWRGQEWFSRPMAEERPVWTHPYFDRGGGEVLMITFATPIRREGRLVGVATADLSLDGMVERLRALKPGGDGQAFLVNQDGGLLAHPALGKLDDPGSGRGLPRLGALKSMLEHKGEDALSAKDPFSRRASWLVEVPLRALEPRRGGQAWSLVVSWPERLRTQPLADLGKRFLVLYLALGGAALLFLNRSLDDLVSRPVARLAAQARSFASGDFRPLRQPPEEAHELQELGQAIQSLGKTLEGQAPPAGEGRP
jgi:sigma-B regulation protein RsbU (phosphoserine phosphatase)